MFTEEEFEVLLREREEEEKDLERQELLEGGCCSAPTFGNLEGEEIKKIERAFSIDIAETVSIFLDLQYETDCLKEELQAGLEEYFSGSDQKPLTQQQKESINYLYWEEVLSLDELAEYTKLDTRLIKKVIEKEIESECFTCERKIKIKIDSIDYFENLRKKINSGGFDVWDKLMLQHFCKKPCQADAKNEFENEKILRIIKIQELKSLPYKEYLKTDHWQSLRREALLLSGRSCALCPSKNQQLHVHHKTYVNKGQEPQKDLIVLCKDCHKKFHGIK